MRKISEVFAMGPENPRDLSRGRQTEISIAIPVRQSNTKKPVRIRLAGFFVSGGNKPGQTDSLEQAHDRLAGTGLDIRVRPECGPPKNSTGVSCQNAAGQSVYEAGSDRKPGEI